MKKFDYTYSAPTEEERKEIEALRREYSPSENKGALEQLRALDKKVRLPADIAAVVLGIAGLLLLGVGMCLTMDVLASGTVFFALGVVVGIFGIGLTIANYFIYKAILNHRKKKYGEEVLKLTEQLLNGGGFTKS
ncbi:MAG: dihydropteridine reductase [Clostridia bacterium]|nr:dihydropteridine reductase [Clostridia bacterium]